MERSGTSLVHNQAVVVQQFHPNLLGETASRNVQEGGLARAAGQADRRAEGVRQTAAGGLRANYQPPHDVAARVADIDSQRDPEVLAEITLKSGLDRQCDLPAQILGD
jgi:hypothetical protein